ncbi:hypothetical protein AWB90_05315 [Mycobacterium paraense]|uniref:Phage capsid protein n=1 Tax=Mycobacterium paraense TaxID=767916 RepID=A0A1X2AJ14_9MYCO|nr:hypothetical protein [Mycobacterium paraense]ORW51343.1 hypothetical protein AWB90_05315 [Mycobacterium paraense]
MTTTETTTDTTPENETGTADTDAAPEDYDAILAGLEADRDQWKQRAEMAEQNVEDLRQRADAAEAAVAAAQANPGEPEPDPAADHSAQAENEPQNEPEGENQPKGRDGRYRERLREAEAERAALAETLAQTRRSIIDQHIASAGYKPEAFQELAIEDVINDAGVIDTDKLAAAVTARADTLGLARQSRRPQPDRLLGNGGDAASISDRQKWDAAFTG